MAAADNLIWIGVSCCVGALVVNIFPRAAYDFGADPGGVWALFGFGVFLIIAAIFAGAGRGRCPHDAPPR